MMDDVVIDGINVVTKIDEIDSVVSSTVGVFIVTIFEVGEGDEFLDVTNVDVSAFDIIVDMVLRKYVDKPDEIYRNLRKLMFCLSILTTKYCRCGFCR